MNTPAACGGAGDVSIRFEVLCPKGRGIKERFGQKETYNQRIVLEIFVCEKKLFDIGAAEITLDPGLAQHPKEKKPGGGKTDKVQPECVGQHC